MYSSDDEPKKPKGKSRRELPTGAVATLKAWLLSPEHFTHPYPTPQDQIILMQKTGIDKKQLKNWFTNARRRIWKPMLKKQLEAGKLAATAGGGGGLSQQGGGGLTNQQEQVVSAPPPPPQQEMYNNYQQATTVTQGSDEYEYGQQQPQYQDNGGYGYDSQQYQQDTTTAQQPEQFPNCNSIGSLAPLNSNGLSSISSFGRMFKTDSHAVLMELFARDQDLVKQASGQKGGMIQAAAVGNTNSVGSSGGMTNGISSASMAREINKEMMNNSATNAAGSLLSSAAAASSSSTTGNLRSTYNNNSSSGSPQQQKVTFGNTNTQSSTVPSLSSWPHFSSVSSLNNMGNGAGNSLGLKGVKSITNLSAADLSSQGNLNKMGNLAHVKSIENMVRSACVVDLFGVVCFFNVCCRVDSFLTYDMHPPFATSSPASIRDVVTPLPSWKSSLMTRVDWGVAVVTLVVAAVVNGVSRENVKKMIMPSAYHLMGMTAPRQIPSHPRPLLSLLIQQFLPRLLSPRMA